MRTTGPAIEKIDDGGDFQERKRAYFQRSKLSARVYENAVGGWCGGARRQMVGEILLGCEKYKRKESLVVVVDITTITSPCPSFQSSKELKE